MSDLQLDWATARTAPKKHTARPVITEWRIIPGIVGTQPVWSETCADCGRPVRQMTGIRRPGGGTTFWHAAGKAGPDDPRRTKTPEHRAAISAGMRAANARRKAARS